VTKGYLTLPWSFVSQNPSFSLKVDGFSPRYIRPHPYCNQDIVAVARGPIVYCVEDVDNPWVVNHFKDVAIDTTVELQEVPDRATGEEFVAITACGAARSIDPASWDLLSQDTTRSANGPGLKPQREDLKFIPYYARANRGGSGQMRVGLRIARE
jgi:DUF1680 family protein